jgi:hypothetical protein
MALTVAPAPPSWTGGLAKATAAGNTSVATASTDLFGSSNAKARSGGLATSVGEDGGDANATASSLGRASADAARDHPGHIPPGKALTSAVATASKGEFRSGPLRCKAPLRRILSVVSQRRPVTAAGQPRPRACEAGMRRPRPPTIASLQQEPRASIPRGVHVRACTGYRKGVLRSGRRCDRRFTGVLHCLCGRIRIGEWTI